MSMIRNVTSLIALTFSVSTFAYEETDEIEKIEVKGEILPTVASDAANAVDIVNMQQIERLGATHLQDMLQQMGNVNFSAGSSRARFIQIRGIGERSQFVDPVNPSVGIAIDGIDYSGVGGAAMMFDVEQIEVFKGPQGTSIGANAMAGFVNISSAETGLAHPTRLRLEAGNYGYTNLGFATGGDINESNAYRVSINKVDGDGYINNTHLNRDDTNGFDELAIRANVKSIITNDWIIASTLHKFDIDNGYDTFSLDNNRNTLSDQPGFDRQDTTSVGVISYYRGAEQFNNKVAFSSSHTTTEYGYDEDWAYDGIHPDGYTSTDAYFRDKAQYQFDVAFSSKEDDLVVGLFGRSITEELTRDYVYAAGIFESENEVNNFAIYGEKRFEGSDTMEISTGLRFERYSGEYVDNAGTAHDFDDNMWGGHVSASNKYSDNFLTYIRISRGFKSGGVNGEALGRVGDLQNDLDRAELSQYSTFRPEVLENIEMGIRASNNKNTLTASANIFYATRDNIQIKQWLTNQADVQNNSANPIFIGYISNAPQGVNYGLETNVKYEPNSFMSITAGLSLLETEVDNINRKFTDPETWEDKIIVIQDREQAHAPSYQFHLGGNFRVTDRIEASVSLTGKDEFYYSFSHDQKSEAMQLINASVIYIGDNMDITFWARNLTDETYGVRGFYFGNDPRDGWENKLYEQFGEPFVYGVKVDFVF
ncbi:TonB-dependent receptor [Psychrosphaera sp. 1_MG-2023]|uniref:TonB-dependent receptor n=1 Tax=Psychrosphaera sp. 1_MG-2023 TaxID=3062643 RepID=UPI0026E26DE1|nr:TonB-dependent receptor [Psychrosphaera sp. 1_MG-2023]MDO6719028.1 TonB-dependent receptor [Psychrosphaera sp. 1_MG-2023]